MHGHRTNGAMVLMALGLLSLQAASGEPAPPAGAMPTWTLAFSPEDIVIGPRLKAIRTRHRWSQGEVAVRKSAIPIPAPGCRMDYLILTIPSYYPEHPNQPSPAERRAAEDALLAMTERGSGRFTAHIEGPFWRQGPTGPELTACNLFFSLPLSFRLDDAPAPR